MKPRLSFSKFPNLQTLVKWRNSICCASSLYIPGPNEFVEGALALPWDPQPRYITGRLARTRGVENANRLVASAKSWLSHQNADPTQPLLPLTAPEGIQKISPLEASQQYLLHLRLAWDAAHPERQAC